MRTAIATLCLFSIAATLPPLPTTTAPRLTHTRKLQTPRAADQTPKLATASVVVTTPKPVQYALNLNLPRDRFLTFQYPPGIDPAVYNWEVQTATGVPPTWVHYCDYTNNRIAIYPTDKQRFFRVKGTPK